MSCERDYCFHHIFFSQLIIFIFNLSLRIKKSFKGLYIIENEADRKEKLLLKQKQQIKNEQLANSHNNLQQSQIDSTNNQQQQQQQQACTCGFSAIVNRKLLSSKALAVNLNELIKEIKRSKSSKSFSSSANILPYLKLIELINSNFSQKNNKQNLLSLIQQFIIIDSNNCNGLFYEDYLESLNLNVPHSLLKQCIKLRNDQKNVRNYLINCILIRENYKWKKSFTPPMRSIETVSSAVEQHDHPDQQKPSDIEKSKKGNKKQQLPALNNNKKQSQAQLANGSTSTNNMIDLVDENLLRKQNGHYESLNSNLLDLFDQKYSCSYLSIQEQHDLFYSNESQFGTNPNRKTIEFDDEELLNENNNMIGNEIIRNIKKHGKQRTKTSLKVVNLNELDENKSCSNVLKRLILKTRHNKSLNKSNENEMKLKLDKLATKSNLLHKWLYDKQEIKSNLELTKSLKQIQPLLEETVQKKYTTSKMWESFQGPLTWQHFCRLAFRETSSNNISSHHHFNQNPSANGNANSSSSAGSMNSSGIGSSSSSSSNSSNNNSNNGSNNGSSNGGSNNSNSNSSSNGANNSNNSSNHQQQLNCYEPEPIPSLLVSSSFDKEWLAISPYAIKFWDKLNLEPYSKPKNIAYIVLVPDFDGSSSNQIDFDNLNIKNLNFEENDPFNYLKKSFHNNSSKTFDFTNISNNESINQSIKEYFKELTSIYELCRLGLHRPALRIAPDNGFIRVPLFRTTSSFSSTSSSSSASSSLNSKNAKSTSNLKTFNDSLKTENIEDLNKIIKTPGGEEEKDIKPIINSSGMPTGIPAFSKIGSENNLKDLNSATSSSTRIQVDQWFDQIQENKSTSLIGKNLKSFARIFKLLALKVTNGYQSTLSSTIQSSFFSQSMLNSTSSYSSQNMPTTKLNTFASSIIPTHSAINLDRTIYDEFKPSKYATSSSNSSNNAIANPSLSTSSSSTSSSNVLSALQQNTNDPSSSLLSSLLNQNVIQPIEINLDSSQNAFHSFNHHNSPIDLHSHLASHHQQQQQAQILTNYNQQQQHQSSLNSLDDCLFPSSNFHQQPQSQQQQQQLQHQKQHATTTNLSHLTQNMTSSPVLLVYIIDPFDQYLYNTKRAKQSNNTNSKSNKNLRRSRSKKDLNNQSIDEQEMLDEEQTTAGAAVNDDQEHSQNDVKFNELDLKRLRTLGLFKAYLELLDNIPDLFKYSLQFQIVPLSLCLDLQQQSTSFYMQSIMQMKTSKSNYSSCFATGIGTGCSDFDMDFKLSILKMQAFNVFSLSKKFFMSPAHNYYLQTQQQQLQQNNTRSKTLTYFGPTGAEEHFLKENLIEAASISTCQPKSSFQLNKLVNLDQMKKWLFYSPLFILAPSTISNSTVSLAASNLFFKAKPSETANSNSASTSAISNKASTLNQQPQQNCGTGECNSLMANFIQLNMSNSNYGYLTNNPTVSLSGISATTSTTSNSNSKNSKNEVTLNANANSMIQQPYQQQCNVLFVAYCLSEDQRYLLTSCCDENGELLESTSILIEIDERDKRKNNQHARRIGLRKLWEFIIVVISQTCKPWRLVIGRLGRIGHSELRGWGCLLSKKNLQRVCNEFKEQCESCNVFGNMEMPSILSACLISMESCENICIYPESYSREDKLAAAALNGQQLSSNHLAQSYGVSCTHILTFPASAIIQPQSSSVIGSIKDGGDAGGKSDMHPMDDFFDLFTNMGDDDEMMADLLTDDPNAKGFNESGNNNEGDQVNHKEKVRFQFQLAVNFFNYII